MTEFKNEIYKNITITYYVHEDGYFSASALDILSTNNENSDRNINNGYPYLKSAEEDIKDKIDSFLKLTPKDYKELAEHLTSTLIWTSYEDCLVDEFICKTIVENFINRLKHETTTPN